MTVKTNIVLFSLMLTGLMMTLIGCQSDTSEGDNDVRDVMIEWIDLFNGKNLDNWIPKIAKHELGNNYLNTFRVKDGNLMVNYDDYESFDDQFGHLFYDKSFSAYYLAVEYRFVGEQAPGGPEWGWRNSGAMIHCQEPKTILKDQNFPISIKCQFMGGPEEGERRTSNLCTPGTNVVMENELFTPHCANSSSKTYRGDQWVRATFLVLKDSLIQHYLEGEVVLQYTNPQIGGGMVAPVDPDVYKDGMRLTEGYIAIQGESAPIEFREIALVDLDPIYTDKELLTRTISELVSADKGVY